MSAPGHGGARPGAGRKPNAAKYSAPLEKASDHLAYELPECVKALLDLALGKCWEEEWAPAGTLMRKDVLRVKPPGPDFLASGDDEGDGAPCSTPRPATPTNSSRRPRGRARPRTPKSPSMPSIESILSVIGLIVLAVIGAKVLLIAMFLIAMFLIVLAIIGRRPSSRVDPRRHHRKG